MNRSVLLMIGIASFAWSVRSEAVAADRPNILCIVGDDMGYADVGFHGCKDIPTPHLDALATSGVKFTSGYVTGPYCSPTRAGLLTGRYQTRFGHEFNPGQQDAGLPLTEKTIADHLRALGYRTACVGKWHLGSDVARHPQQRGFDEYFGFLGGAHSFFDKQGILRGTVQVEAMDYTTDAFGREAAEFIGKQQAGQPWFLYLSFNAVHTPMHATEDRLEKFSSIAGQQRRTYAAMMSAMDDAIGVTLEKLDATGQTNNTLVAFISDNGGPVMRGVTVNGSINTPLRGSKRTTLEGGVRVPFLISWPGHVESQVYDQPVIQLDLTATALTLAGAKDDVTTKLEGVNLIPFVSGETSNAPHKALYWRFGQQMAVRSGDFKLVRYDLNAEAKPDDPEPGISTARLYNLAADVHEDNDLAAAMPDKARELQLLWNEWNRSNVEPLWGGGRTSNARRAGAQTGKAKNRKQQAAQQ